jgi:sulfite reductase alpha subunit-like flavoprotein
MSLAQHCTDPKEKVAMEWLCSKGSEGKALWSHFIEEQGLGVGELIALFPSCCPPIAALASTANKLPPRLYSIASSPLNCARIATIAFSVVQYSSCVIVDGHKVTTVQRDGLCTSYLERLSKPLLCNEGPSNHTIRIFPKPSVDFHLPGSLSIPLVMLAIISIIL